MKHTQNPKLRKAELDDLPTLQRFKLGLIQAELPMDETIKEDATSYYDLKELIQSPDADIFVVEVDQQLVASGYAKIMEDHPYLKHDKQGYLGFMFVLEDFRGRGYSQQILEALTSWCKNRGVFEIRLDVYSMNQAALRAYEKAGFKSHLIKMRMNIEKK
jgi:RimJ/RimL family protein N-acetyltransferase